MDGLQWKMQVKWMLWGYPHFRKHPFRDSVWYQAFQTYQDFRPQATKSWAFNQPKVVTVPNSIQYLRFAQHCNMIVVGDQKTCWCLVGKGGTSIITINHYGSLVCSNYWPLWSIVTINHHDLYWLLTIVGPSPIPYLLSTSKKIHPTHLPTSHHRAPAVAARSSPRTRLPSEHWPLGGIVRGL